MAARTLDVRTALQPLLAQVGYTLERLKAHALGAPHIPTFEALRAEGLEVLTTELEINDAQAGAQARVDIADDRLDAFAGKLSKTVLGIVDDDREHVLYVHYFGTKTLTEFKRPVLGAQLVTMRKWVQSLTESPHELLLALAPELTLLVNEADAAVQARDTVQQGNRNFRDTGQRYQWIARLNAARKELHGTLAKMPHEHTGLPSSFADQFFLRKVGKRGSGEEEETVESVQEYIEGLQEELAGAELRLAELEQAEEDARKAAALLEAEKAQLAELDKAAMALEKQRAALRARIEAEETA
ncbi:hypothetical protein [Chondromyces apiculatus]|uniref:Uncharacterized protein n=1 Tax=Chondromyces apiculatus DSM 436 TaxID=1192034 RepID=A0A017T2Q6_9BACT|nr:hypothetical protein [Chondromyces apiculatus]EYF03105.1 Hypothetical protein CAP_6219 [Chondromyces apiculatus DSM 436]